MNDILVYVSLGLSAAAIGLSIVFYFLLKNRIDKANLNIKDVAVDLNKVAADENQTWDGKQ